MKEVLLKVENAVIKTPYGEIGGSNPLNLEVKSGSITSFRNARTASLIFRFLAGKGNLLSGSVTLNDDHYEEFMNTPALKENWLRRIGFAYRDKGLISNQSLYENVALPWKYHVAGKEDCLSPDEALEQAGVPEDQWNQRPHLVSWQMLKWTLLARSAVLNPDILMLDDPTCLLGYDDFSKLRRWIRDRASEGKIVLLGTNDTPFGLAVGDYIFDPDNSTHLTIAESDLPASLQQLGKDLAQCLKEDNP